MRPKRTGLLSPASLLLPIVALIGCEPDVTSPDPLEVDSDVAAALEVLGFTPENATLEGGQIIIEGDMVVDRADLLARARAMRQVEQIPAPRPDLPLVASFQRIWSNCPIIPDWGGCSGPVSSSQIGSLDVVINSSVPPGWAQAMREAMNHWNNVAGSKVRFREVTSGADIDVSGSFSLPSNVRGRADYPLWGGGPGGDVKLNSFMEPTLSHAQKVSTSAHELGHTLGFMHTNTNDGRHISGTPSSDVRSVMNTPSPSWQGFSNGDKLAFIYIYPTGAPSVSVSFVNNRPRITWSSVPEASGYTLRLFTKPCEWQGGGGSRSGSSNCSVEEQLRIDTSSLSYSDGARTYTGKTQCVAYYEVHAKFGNLVGFSGQRRDVPVCP